MKRRSHAMSPFSNEIQIIPNSGTTRLDASACLGENRKLRNAIYALQLWRKRLTTD
jgi:hypothetical protein